MKHIGRSVKVGLKKKVYAHLAKVNKWKADEVEAYIGFCFQEHKERSKIKWTLNVKILNEKLGVDENLIEEGLRSKTLGNPTWKRKKKKKKVVAKKKRPLKKAAPKKKQPAKKGK